MSKYFDKTGLSVSDGSDADDSCLVAIICANFGIGDVEFILHAFEHGFYNAAFLFEGNDTGKVKFEFAVSDFCI